MFRKILVPVDFTSKNEAAIEAVSELVNGHPAEVVLMHVIERIQLLPSRETRAFYNRLKRNADEKIRKLAKRFSRKIKVKTNIVFGNRAREIIRYSIENGTDLIVLASHKIDSASMHEGWGTISYRVAILAQCPVLLVK